MRAMFDAGIRYVTSDSSASGYDNPSPNAGLYDRGSRRSCCPAAPRTTSATTSSNAEQWMAEYNDNYRSVLGARSTYNEILDAESDALLQYLLKGENDPWMFHQPNLRAYDGRRSLLGDLLDVHVHEVRAPRDESPLISPEMEVLGALVAARMRLNASGATVTVDPNCDTITVRVANAAIVPVTGACGGNRESYAGAADSRRSIFRRGARRPCRCRTALAAARLDGRGRERRLHRRGGQRRQRWLAGRRRAGSGASCFRATRSRWWSGRSVGPAPRR